MAVSNHVESITKIAGADLSLNRYHFVADDGSGDTVTVCTTPNGGLSAAPIGILQQVEIAGRAVPVGVSGQSKCQAGDTVTQGKYVTCNSAGHATHAGSGDAVIARAEESAVDGDIFKVSIVTPFDLIGTN